MAGMRGARREGGFGSNRPLALCPRDDGALSRKRAIAQTTNVVSPAFVALGRQAGRDRRVAGGAGQRAAVKLWELPHPLGTGVGSVRATSGARGRAVDVASTGRRRRTNAPRARSDAVAGGTGAILLPGSDSIAISSDTSL